MSSWPQGPKATSSQVHWEFQFMEVQSPSSPLLSETLKITVGSLELCLHRIGEKNKISLSTHTQPNRGRKDSIELTKVPERLWFYSELHCCSRPLCSASQGVTLFVDHNLGSPKHMKGYFQRQSRYRLWCHVPKRHAVDP